MDNTSFTTAYQTKGWGSQESKSGPGSELAYTALLRKTLPALLNALECKTLLDAPCGDYHWMKEVNLGGIRYMGGDIVPEIVADLQSRYPAVDFRRLDIANDPLPGADLWLCRDVLFHLSLADIRRVLVNFVQSDIRYLATSHFFDCPQNEEMPTHYKTYRSINLCLPPFSLPQPDHCLKDWIPPWPERWLAFWERERIVAWYEKQK